MTEHLNPEFTQENFGESSDGDAGGGFAGGGALQDVAGLREIVFQGAGKISVAGSRRRNSFVFCRITLAYGKRLFPILPVAVNDLQRDR